MAELRIVIKTGPWKETRLRNIEKHTGELIVLTNNEREICAALPWSGSIETRILEVIAENADYVIVC